MIKPKNDDTSYLDHVRIQTIDDIQYIAAIFYWKHSSGKDAHCLMRAYIKPDGSCTVLLSAMRFGYDYQPFYEIIDLVNRLYPIFLETFEVQPENIQWVFHIGNFSEYEHESVPDSFFYEPLRFKDGKFHEEVMSDWREMPAGKIKEYIPFEIEPGADLIEHLGWGEYPMGRGEV